MPVFWFSLDYFVLALFASVVLALVCSVLRQEIGWEERLRDDLCVVELWDSFDACGVHHHHHQVSLIKQVDNRNSVYNVNKQ